MIKIEQKLEINRTVADVFAFLTDHENDSKWRSGVVESRKTSEGPVGVGSTGSEVLQFLGRRMETSYEITEFEQDKKLSFKTTSGPVPMEGGYLLEASGGGTRIAFSIQGDASGFFKLAEPVLARWSRDRSTPTSAT